MIRGLIEPNLLRSVRSEIQDSLSFTPKETDIYKIHQSGDLTNLDGLDDASLSRLPSLLRLRNALYSSKFRTYLSAVTGAGPLSGKKTDMAINVYTPGCHLLCHDDVIGSRRVSYILYLTDPDRPWREAWGGALRLYPTNVFTDEDGSEIKLPSPDHSLSIAPAFNQLSFFAVQPGESFHDVEEVYARLPEEQDTAADSERVRMAISGWYHIPQEGEEGFEAGLEERLAEKSSLMQLQGSANQFDLPQSQVHVYTEEVQGKGKAKAAVTEDGDEDLTQEDIDLLLKYIKLSYLIPLVMEQVKEEFAEESCVQLDEFLSDSFAETLRKYIEGEEQKFLPGPAAEIEGTTEWRVARPPHKHRFLYQQSRLPEEGENPEGRTPLQELLSDLLPSTAFRKWLSLITAVRLESHNLLARRFRRGHDYTLATGGDDTRSRVEITLGITPTGGWDEEGEDNERTEHEEDVPIASGSNSGAQEGKRREGEAKGGNVGGYEVYMAGDDEADSDDKVAPMDPAVYRSSGGAGGDDQEDNGILFSMPAGWSKLSIVLRDQGVLRFVKYVSRSANGDRWDVLGEFGVSPDDDVEDDGDDDEEDASGC